MVAFPNGPKYDPSSGPPEVVPGFIVLGNLVSAFSWINVLLCRVVDELPPEHWEAMLMPAAVALADRTARFTPDRTAAAGCRLEIDRVRVPEQLVSMFLRPEIRAIFAKVAAVFVANDPRVSSYPLPKSIMLAGTADEWLALV